MYRSPSESSKAVRTVCLQFDGNLCMTAIAVFRTSTFCVASPGRNFMIRGKRQTLKASEAMVRRRFAELDKKNFTILDKMFDPSYALHFAGISSAMNLETTKHFYRMLYTAFPDLHHVILEQISARDKVVTRWAARGTHRSEWMGIPATGKQIVLKGINIYKLTRGKLSESHVNWDMLGLMQQLGVVSQGLQVPDQETKSS